MSSNRHYHDQMMDYKELYDKELEKEAFKQFHLNPKQNIDKIDASQKSNVVYKKSDTFAKIYHRHSISIIFGYLELAKLLQI